MVGFGGPEGHDEVLPFLRHVTAGRGVPAERLELVARRYHERGGASPLPDQVRRAAHLLQEALEGSGTSLPVTPAFLHSRPFVTDALGSLAAAGHRHLLAITTSPYGSPSSCRRYHEAVARARAERGPDAPLVSFTRRWWDHPLFLEAFTDATRSALRRLEPDRRSRARLVATAHSIPVADAATCPYEAELTTLAHALARRLRVPPGAIDLVWQSRSGPPRVPWLEPDVCDHLRVLAREGVDTVVLVPLGFVSDHFEVVWDLDVEAARTADEVGIRLERAVTPGTAPDPRLVELWHELVTERLALRPPRPRSIRAGGPEPSTCPSGCCHPGVTTAPGVPGDAAAHSPRVVPHPPRELR